MKFFKIFLFLFLIENIVLSLDFSSMHVKFKLNSFFEPVIKTNRSKWLKMNPSLKPVINLFSTYYDLVSVKKYNNCLDKSNAITKFNMIQEDLTQRLRSNSILSKKKLAKTYAFMYAILKSEKEKKLKEIGLKLNMRLNDFRKSESSLRVPFKWG